MDAIRDPTVLPLEKQVIDQKKRIDQIIPYIKGHIMSSKIFSLLEKNIHPQVIFTEIELDTKQGILKIDCIGDDFVVMGQQIKTFKESPKIISLVAKQVGLEKEENKVGFSLEIMLDKEIFKY